MTVYRIVQEALTNALRYARQAATLVRLSWEPDQLRVEILDDGPATGGEARAAVGAWSGCASARRWSAAGWRRARGWAAGTPSGRGSRSNRGGAGGGRGHVSGPHLRVLIADDQALVRAGFRMILEAQPDIEVVAEAADGEAAVR